MTTAPTGTGRVAWRLGLVDLAGLVAVLVLTVTVFPHNSALFLLLLWTAVGCALAAWSVSRLAGGVWARRAVGGLVVVCLATTVLSVVVVHAEASALVDGRVTALAGSEGAGCPATTAFTLTGMSPGDVEVSDVNARIVSHSRPTGGAGSSCRAPDAASRPSVEFLLTANGTAVHSRYGEGLGADTDRDSSLLHLSRNEVVALTVAMTTTDWDVEWYLEVSVHTDHSARTVEISDHGRPFRTAAADPG